MEDKLKLPLVTVIVIAYNSARFVLETLESIKTQTYSNLELIVTDDCSLDDTVKLCQSWINENTDRFYKAVVVTAPKNTGIPANLNRGLEVSHGDWIKCIAGDDLLTEMCIDELINHISVSGKEIKVLSSAIIRFSGDSYKEGQIKRNPYTRFCSDESSAAEQYDMLLRTNMVFAATAIIRRDLLVSVNGFDERYPLLEDWPLWLKLTGNGHKLFYLDQPLIYYRVHDTNLSQTTIRNFLYHPMNKIVLKFKKEELAPNLPFIERWGLKHDLIAIKTCFLLGNNRKNPLTWLIYHVFNISNPFFTYLRLKKIFGKG